MSGGANKRTIHSKMGVRQLHREFIARSRPIELAFFLQDLDDPYNVGGMFRVADGCGARLIVTSGNTPVPPHPQIHVTSMGHHRRIAHRHFSAHEEAAVWLKGEGYALIAIEIAEGAVPYVQFEWPDKVCLVLGNEVNGVYGGVMKHRDAAVYIPMFGKGRSLNVHVSAAVVAFDLRTRS
jgi:tRNA (guanosine-2'-O-)-methyltransferase